MGPYKRKEIARQSSGERQTPIGDRQIELETGVKQQKAPFAMRSGAWLTGLPDLQSHLRVMTYVQTKERSRRKLQPTMYAMLFPWFSGYGCGRRAWAVFRSAEHFEEVATRPQPAFSRGLCR